MRKISLVITIILMSAQLRAQQEVIYHIFQRSFFDGNGDGHGDLKGIEQKLDYLQELGVTAILLTPLYQSEFYHNYFATDFEKIDPEYGSMQDYLSLVKEIHKRGMKIYQDVEMQYVTHEHPWFKESINKPDSRFSSYVYYLDSLNQKPFWFYNIPEFTTYNNSKQKIAVVNMNDPEVRKYTADVLTFWIDPNRDGNFDDGVDGFRFDHMMDDLDNFKKLPNLFKTFWVPVIGQLRKANPQITIIAEQANWFSLGHEYFRDANVDQVFAFYLSWAIESMDKQNLIKAADSTLTKNPAGKHHIVFVENHDTRRIASVKNMTPGKLKVAATLNLLIGGVPLIYYGQELGMKGKQMKGMTDGNDIPIREAFEWYASGNGKGMALWYKDSGPWWDSTNIKSHDGISFEEQRNDKASLWNHYKKMNRLKRISVALREGKYQLANNDNEKVFSFTRISGSDKVLVVVNLSDQVQHANIELAVEGRIKWANSFIEHLKLPVTEKRLALDLPAYGFQILQLDN